MHLPSPGEREVRRPIETTLVKARLRSLKTIPNRKAAAPFVEEDRVCILASL